MIRPFRFIGFTFLLSVFLLPSSCKKEIAKPENSLSMIKYFDGGLKDKVNTIEKTKDGGFIYCGYSNADSARTDAFLMKVDGRGKQQWYKIYGGANFDEFRHVIQTSDGGYIAVGQTNSIGFGVTGGTYRLSDYIVKLSADGNVEWEKSHFGAQGCLTNIMETPDHQYLITGYYYPTTYDVFLMKIDASGNVVYGRVYPYFSSIPPFYITNNYNEYGQCVTLANDGSVIIGGVMSKSNLVAEAQNHVTFLMKTNANGISEFMYPMYNLMRGRIYSTAWGEIQRRLEPVKILNLPDGYLIGTYTEDPSTMIMKMQLIKTGLNGMVQWHKEYKGLGNAMLYHLEANPDGTLLLVGASTDKLMSWQFPEMFQNLKVMILKTDKDGNEIWTQYIGGENTVSYSKCVQPLPDGGWSIAGYSCSNEGGYDIMSWMQVDQNGVLMKNKN